MSLFSLVATQKNQFHYSISSKHLSSIWVEMTAAEQVKVIRDAMAEGIIYFSNEYTLEEYGCKVTLADSMNGVNYDNYN